MGEILKKKVNQSLSAAGRGARGSAMLRRMRGAVHPDLWLSISSWDPRGETPGLCCGDARNIRQRAWALTHTRVGGPGPSGAAGHPGAHPLAAGVRAGRRPVPPASHTAWPLVTGTMAPANEDAVAGELFTATLTSPGRGERSRAGNQ